MTDDYSSECFFISPIGNDGTPERDRNDGVRDLIVRPAATQVDLVALRADEIGQPGNVNLQVINHVLNAGVAVADVTGANPNVYYELGIRHAFGLPVVLITEESLPFDIVQERAIFFDHANLKTVAKAKDQVVEHLETLRDNPDAVESPIERAADLRRLGEGSPVERTLADLVQAIQELQ